MSTKIFPQVIFVTLEHSGTVNEFISVSLNTDEAIGNERKKIVGVYQFVAANELTARPPLSTKRRTRKMA
jgi:hypothetical protein